MSAEWGGGSDTRWRTFRAWVLERDRGRCLIGGQGCTGRATHVDHIVPLSKGGAKYSPDNVRAACATCNLSRGDRGAAPQPEPRRVSSW